MKKSKLKLFFIIPIVTLVSTFIAGALLEKLNPTSVSKIGWWFIILSIWQMWAIFYGFSIWLILLILIKLKSFFSKILH